MSDRTTHTALVHGESKVGKSWLGDTIPGPRLILDGEGRAKYTPSGPKKWWNPRNEPPPRYDGTWETCIADVTEYSVMDIAYRHLRTGDHDFVSCNVDSLMEIQKRKMDDEVGSSPMQIQDWGTLLRDLEKLVRNFRDLTHVNNNTMSVIVFNVGTDLRDGVQRPLLQGALRTTVPYYIDTIGYLYKRPITSPEGSTTYVRELLIDSIPGFVAGDGTSFLPGPVIQNPNFTEMYKIIDQAFKAKQTQEVASV